MDDIAQLHKELERASRANSLLADSLMKESFETLERELMEGLLATSAEDASRREKIHMMLVYGRKWRNLLTSMVETGKLASLQLEEKRKLKIWGR